MINRTNNTGLTLLVCGVLAIATGVIFWPVTHHAFISLDDPLYVTGNPHVLTGWSWANFLWAFQTGYAANWHPLTWLSHMLDVQLWGLNPGGHHFVSLMLHCANAVLLFLLLKRMTGAFWRSALVAALFALHPLHVESVAWAAERKDVLSGFFFMLTLLAYSRYVECGLRIAECGIGTGGRRSALGGQKAGLRQEAMARQTENESHETETRFNVSTFQRFNPLTLQPFNPSTTWYLLALLAFALGLMSKPMLVTVPCLMLLLDFWPLQRLPLQRWSELKFTAPPFSSALLEKLPFLILALASSAVTFAVQDQGHAVGPLASLALLPRLANAALSYFNYLGKTIWPVELSVYYPHPFLAAPDSYRLLTTPVILSSVVILVLTIGILLRAREQPYLFTGWFWYLGMLVPVIGLVQVGSQAMADRYTYLPLVGMFICMVWALSDALQQFRRTVLAAAAIGVVLACAMATSRQLSYWQDDVTLFRHAVAVSVYNGPAHFFLGTALGNQGKYDEALQELREAVKIVPDFQPDNVEAQETLGLIYAQNGQLEDAVPRLEACLRLRPDAQSWYNLGLARVMQGRLAEAITNYQHAVNLKPDWAVAANDLAWLLATHPEPELRNGSEAVRLARRACELSGGKEARFWGTLDAAYAETGDFTNAVGAAEKARDLATAAGQTDIAHAAEQRLQLYRNGKPYHQ